MLVLINFLTLIRVIGTIILVPIYHYYGGLYVGILALICYFTDSIDGILARKYHAATFFGALFDSLADKLFTIVNFIVLYLITPYAIIPIVFELLTIIVQIIKFNKNYNIKSNIIGKSKVWILAICVVLTFIASDIEYLPILNNISIDRLYFYLLLPAIIMEFLTFISYLVEVYPKLQKDVVKDDKIIGLEGLNKWETFKYIWLNNEFYEKHKNDTNLKRLIKWN